MQVGLHILRHFLLLRRQCIILRHRVCYSRGKKKFLWIDVHKHMLSMAICKHFIIISLLRVSWKRCRSPFLEKAWLAEMFQHWGWNKTDSPTSPAAALTSVTTHGSRCAVTFFHNHADIGFHQFGNINDLHQDNIKTKSVSAHFNLLSLLWSIIHLQSHTGHFC